MKRLDNDCSILNSKENSDHFDSYQRKTVMMKLMYVY